MLDVRKKTEKAYLKYEKVLEKWINKHGVTLKDFFDKKAELRSYEKIDDPEKSLLGRDKLIVLSVENRVVAGLKVTHTDFTNYNAKSIYLYNSMLYFQEMTKEDLEKYNFDAKVGEYFIKEDE